MKLSDSGWGLKHELLPGRSAIVGRMKWFIGLFVPCPVALRRRVGGDRLRNRADPCHLRFNGLSLMIQQSFTRRAR